MCYDLNPPSHDPSILNTITMDSSTNYDPVNILNITYPNGNYPHGNITIPALASADLSTIASHDLSTMGTLTISPSTYSTGSLWSGITHNPHGQQLRVQGDAEIQGNLTVKGMDIGETLAKITERLAILQPNKELETRWARLKELADEYRELEKEIIEQEKIYDILKK